MERKLRAMELSEKEVSCCLYVQMLSQFIFKLGKRLNLLDAGGKSLPSDDGSGEKKS